MSDTNTLNLKTQYAALKVAQPKIRIRNAAKKLNVSEAELLLLNIGDGTTLLQAQFQEIIKDLNALGKVMALTRNDSVVHERKGIYDNISFEGPVGLVVTADIDLRLFMMHWKHAFAVVEGERKSIQFFDKSGTAIHKVYLTAESDEAAYEKLVERYRAPQQKNEIVFEDYAASAAELPDSEIDKAAFQADWSELKDTHDFFKLLSKYQLSRTQALRLGAQEFVQQVPNDSSRKILQLAAEQQVPIMVFVGSKACIQIHSGTVNKLAEAGPWYNVLDPMFNLHLNEAEIATTFIVKKPSADGIISSLEVFDQNGAMIVQFFGARKPGIPELPSWRTILKSI